MQLLIKKQKTEVIHYPRLDTILMVENAIKKAKEYPNDLLPDLKVEVSLRGLYAAA